eukprot:scaffold926_cov150-Chaetoceros_neogracile.AAC.2
MGWASDKFVGEESVALLDSRGFEDPIMKAFMRFTVIFWDAMVYFPVVYLLCKRLGQGSHDKTLQLCLFAMLSPAMILIDNGHFQYNNVCLGLALGSFHFMTLSDTIGFYDGIGSVLFSLALNWKQMGLYYAPAVFAFLLGKCFHNQQHILGVMKNIGLLGGSVMGTFFALWYPFFHFRQDESEGLVDVYGPMLRRIFPFSRGLFEGKVSNIWCALNVRPLSIRSRIPVHHQPICALVLTLAMMLPFCVLLFAMGKKKRAASSVDKLKALLWGSAGTSLSFFLASFQVHEKSILFPLAPLMLLEAPMFFMEWTAARLLCDQCPVSVFSMGDQVSGLLEGAAGTGLNIWDSNGCHSLWIAMDISTVHLAKLDRRHGGIALCGMVRFATSKRLGFLCRQINCKGRLSTFWRGAFTPLPSNMN